MHIYSVHCHLNVTLLCINKISLFKKYRKSKLVVASEAAGGRAGTPRGAGAGSSVRGQGHWCGARAHSAREALASSSVRPSTATSMREHDLPVGRANKAAIGDLDAMERDEG